MAVTGAVDGTRAGAGAGVMVKTEAGVGDFTAGAASGN